MSDITLDSYNKSAKELAEYFRGIGPRVKYIDRALKLANKKPGEADVLEIGCGDGRDATDIIKKAKTYIGIDYSEKLLELARAMHPGGKFILADMLTYDYSINTYDIVFSFASLLHLSKRDVKKTLQKVGETLKNGGVFYLSTKWSDEYKEEWKEDQFGKRLFYFYNDKIMENLAKDYFEIVFSEKEIIRDKPWLEMALKKK